jgi:two-component system response regulator HydG
MKNSGTVKVLIVDDSEDTRDIITRTLSGRGYRLFCASGVGEAVDFLDTELVDIVITDLKMAGSSGLDLVKYVTQNLRGIAVIMITGYPSIETAVEAVKNGAEDYLTKPFTEEELLLVLKRVTAHLHDKKIIGIEPTMRNGIVGASDHILKVHEEIKKSAKASLTVLISGESGTGKELVARAIHYQGPRASNPFVPVNCGGIPEELLESELFGYLKGAFTGANETRAGFFQTADGGTIFLDEVSEMSLSMQIKLLRVLQDKEIYMIGTRKPQKVDVRIIAATNRDLLSRVERGAFREDLFYRLNVIPIFVPPLRDRGDDVLMLANHFLQKFALDAGKKPPVFTSNALKALREYRWPGNVRELENIVKHAVVMTDSDLIDVPDLPLLMRFSVPATKGRFRTLAEMEADYVGNVLESVDGNKTRAAAILGIDRKTLRTKLKNNHKENIAGNNSPMG